MLGEDLLEGFPAWELVLYVLLHVHGDSLIDWHFLNVIVSLSWRISLNQLQMKSLERGATTFRPMSKSAVLPLYLVLDFLDVHSKWLLFFLSLGYWWLFSMFGR